RRVLLRAVEARRGAMAAVVARVLDAATGHWLEEQRLETPAIPEGEGAADEQLALATVARRLRAREVTAAGSENADDGTWLREAIRHVVAAHPAAGTVPLRSRAHRLQSASDSRRVLDLVIVVVLFIFAARQGRRVGVDEPAAARTHQHERERAGDLS